MALINGPKFHAGLPDNCPLPGATGVNRRVYRALLKKLPEEKDFHSEAERRKFQPKSGDCKEWGLSAWISLEAAKFAKTIIPGFGKKAVVGFDATPADGFIAHTPTATQPDHHTFWKAVDANIRVRCTIEIESTSP